MDLTKSRAFFDPQTCINEQMHVIGCGAIGSTLIEMLVRVGIDKIHIWDFDKVAAHNITNQMFTNEQIGLLKTEAITKTAEAINPFVQITNHGKWENQKLAGYVFMAVDNIETRKEILKASKYNPMVKALFDFRMRLTDAQHYAAISKDIDELLETMNFTSDEAKEATPVNACGSTLNIVNTVRMIVAAGLSNFMNFMKDPKELKKMIIIDAFSFMLDVY